MQLFNLAAGFTGLRIKGELPRTYVAIVLGILAHWVWEVLVTAIRTEELKFGSWVVVIARIGVAFIVALVTFAAVWKQLENVDPKLRWFVAVSQGFATDALASPVTRPE
jgi:hypothetical protein